MASRSEGPRRDHGGQHAAGLVAAVRPGVRSAALDEDVAFGHLGFAFVHKRIDLALEHDGVVESLRLVKAEMPAGSFVPGIQLFALRRGLSDRGGALGVRRVDDDTKDAAVAPGVEHLLRHSRILVARIVRRMLVSGPQLDDYVAVAALDDVGADPVLHEYRFPLGILAGDDAANLISHVSSR